MLALAACLQRLSAQPGAIANPGHAIRQRKTGRIDLLASEAAAVLLTDDLNAVGAAAITRDDGAGIRTTAVPPKRR
jgi:hypothetical protein